ncbi:MAG: uroporphyrinogen decarboxylase family protein [Planctomycetaceae bacterium]|jgi:uroporphyrinogen decarboxylase|nr:uroporphyrinogen decarboxylase family protein [Planctomycetaceae bacterium]
MKMNGFERIRNVLDGKAADVVPVMLHNFMSAARGVGMTMRQFRSKPENISRAFVEASLRYGLDGILTDVDTALEAYALGAETIFEEDMPAKVVAPISNQIEEVIGKIDTEKLERNERIQIYLDAIRMIRETVGGELFIRGNADQGAFSLAAAVYGISNMMLDLAMPEKEESILRLIERCYAVNLLFHKLVKEAGADMTSFGDSVGSPDLISPKMYQKFVLPFQKKLVADLTQSGIRTVCHICGKTDRILEPMSECGFAGVEIDYKTNVVTVQKTMYGKSVVFGIIDPSGVFCFGNETTVRETTQKVLDVFQGCGLVLGSGCALPAETPPENIKTFVNTVRNYRFSENVF